MFEPTFCLPSQILVSWHSCAIHPYFIDKSHTSINFLNYLITLTKKAHAWCRMFAPLPAACPTAYHAVICLIFVQETIYTLSTEVGWSCKT